MDEVSLAVEDVKRTWDQTVTRIEEHIKEIKNCGKSGKGVQEANYLPRINGAAQDCLQLLRSLQLRLDILGPQLLEDAVDSAMETLISWKQQYQGLHSGLKSANLQAANNIRKAAQEERVLLFGGGEESTVRRRNLQTKVGMTSAAESITESLRRTRQLMVQEVERSVSTLTTFEESSNVLKKAESEYRGHHSLLKHTRCLLTTMRHQDVMDRVIMVAGFLLFMSAVLYVVSKRIGLLALQRKIITGIKSGLLNHEGARKVVTKPTGGEVDFLGQEAQYLNIKDEL